jgi:hypothetical protein
MPANLTIEFYQQILDTSSNFSEEKVQSIANGQYPIILAKDNKFEHKYITADELSLHHHYDATDSDVEAQYALHGYSPIVYDGFDTGGLPFKVIEQTETTGE